VVILLIRKGWAQLAQSRITANSPDFNDLAMVMDALENMHEVGVSITLRRPGGRQTGILVATAKAERKNAQDGVVARSVSRSLPIGSGDPIQTAATLFRLLYGLDKDCSGMWVQEVFT